MRYLITILSVAIVVAGAPLTACGVAVIKGQVTDGASGEPLAYVSVLLNGVTPTGGIIKTGQASDEKGYFRFGDLATGRYTLRFIYIGYEKLENTVEVQHGSVVDLAVKLVVEPIEVDEIIVEGDRYQSEREVQPGFINLDVETLTDIPGIIEADPIRSIQLLPGVQAASDISSGLYIRGGGPDQTMVLLDGVPVYNPTHALGFFSTFNADAVGNVTLYKGAYPAQHGGRLGAVLDVTSRDPAPGGGFRGVGGISTISARVTAEGGLGSNRWLIGGRRTYLEPLLNAIRSEENPVPSYFFYDLNGKFMTAKDNDWLTFGGYLGRDVVGFDLGREGSIDIAWGNKVISGSYNRVFAESLVGTILLSGSEYTSSTDGRIFGTSIVVNNRLRDATLRGDLDWHAGATQRVRGGVQASVYDFWYQQIFNKDEQVGYGNRPYELSVYADDQWWVRTGTTVRLGLRTRYITEGDRLLWEPRFSASQVLGGSWRMKAAAGIYNQYLQLVSTEAFSFGDFYVPIDETATPGQSLQFVLGAEYTPSFRYQLSVEGYYTDLKNLVTFNNNSPADQTSTATADLFYTDGEGYATGVEFFAQRRTGAWTGWLGYTLGWTRRTFAEVNGGEAYPPKYDRRHDINGVVSYGRGKWTYGGAFVFGTGQAYTPASARYGLRDPATGIVPGGGRVLASTKNSARLLPYNRLDISVTRDFKAWGYGAQWFVQVFNLYSRRNEWFVQYGEEDGKVDVTVVKMLPIIPSVGLNFKF